MLCVGSEEECRTPLLDVNSSYSPFCVSCLYISSLLYSVITSVPPPSHSIAVFFNLSLSISVSLFLTVLQILMIW